MTLGHETQNLGGHPTLERTLTRLKIIFRSELGDSASTSEVKKIEIANEFGNFWEFLGKIGKQIGEIGKKWEFWGIWELSTKIQKIMTTSHRS